MAAPTVADPGPAASRPSPSERFVTHPPADDRRFRRAAKWIALAIAGLLVVGIVWALGTNLVNGLVAALPTATPAPTRTPTRTPSPAPTRTTGPSLPSLPALPTLPSLPSLPSLPTLPTQLQASVSAVGAAIGAINESDQGAAKAKAQLETAWATASRQVLSGKGEAKALATFSAKLAAARPHIGPIEYVAISAALKAVEASV